MLPLRPGAVAKITAGDSDERTRELTIGKDKSGKGRRIVLPEQAAIHFATQAASKPPVTLLFTRAGGEQWNSSIWNDPIAAASAALNLPAGVTAYTLRHSTITDLVAGGLPLLAVAQVSDTSAEMIEQHYGHLGRGLVTEALEGLAL